MLTCVCVQPSKVTADTEGVVTACFTEGFLGASHVLQSVLEFHLRYD